MDRPKTRPKQNHRPEVGRLDDRVLLTAGVGLRTLTPFDVLTNPKGYQVIRPNTPVLPFAAPLSTATFIDPSVFVINGAHTVVGTKTYVGPHATLNSRTGFIKIGTGSAVLDNASIVSNPTGAKHFPTSVIIGDKVQIDYGARVYGPSTIGAFGASSANTEIGPNAQIDGATITPGAIVGALARVGPGVTVPTGVYVLPGMNVTTDAEASNPSLGMVEKIPAAVSSALSTSLTRDAQLAAGYTNLYQGNSATGANPGTTSTTVNNGDLAAVTGASAEPGPSTSTATTNIGFETAGTLPSFPGKTGALFPNSLPNINARVIGDVRFYQRAKTVNYNLTHSDAIQADQGQPIFFANAPLTGSNVTITSPGGYTTSTTTTTTTNGTTTSTTTSKLAGAVGVGFNFIAESGADILGGTNNGYSIGNNVTVDADAVVSNSSLGDNVTIGPKAYVSNSSIPAGTVIPAGAIVVNGKITGSVQW